MGEVDSDTLESLVETYNENGFDVTIENSGAGMLAFHESRTNFRILGDIAMAHGLAVTAWNPDREPPALWFSPVETVEKEVTRTRRVMQFPTPAEYGEPFHGAPYEYEIGGEE